MSDLLGSICRHCTKKIDGLRFCGEVLDVDAFTGGFNMQIAFATGFVAGNTID